MTMIAERLFRVDPRLVHATMMNVWVPTTGARVLVIADGALEGDSKLRAIHEMSAMGLVEVRFRSEETVAAELDACGERVPVIVLFSSLRGALKAVQHGLPVERLNVGHVPEGPGRQEMHPAVHLGPKDFALIGKLQKRGVEVFIQPLPNDKLKVVPPQLVRPAPAPAPRVSTVAEEALRVVNARGLHLRAANVFAQACSKLDCEVNVMARGSQINAKSLLGLTTLGATMGTLLQVRIEGPGAGDAMNAIRALFASGFEEGVDWVEDAAGGVS